MKKIFSFLYIILLMTAAGAQERLFRFQYKDGETSRILSTVEEDVFINGAFFHHAKILNRVFCKVTEVDKNGRGRYEATFMTSESASSGGGDNFSWGNKYESVFWRSGRGEYEIGDNYFMPTVRNVPVFPVRKVKPGDTWTNEGREAHDMRQTFGVEKPFEVPFTAQYKYLRDEKSPDGGKSFAIIDVKYDIGFHSPTKKITEAEINNPAVTTGYSHQTLYWDIERGTLDNYNEDFSIEVTTYAGNKITFKGTANARINETQQTATAENLKKISESVTDMGLKNIDVKKSDKGIIISVENIQFKADSSVLEESEKTKLRNIAGILNNYKNDLLITGYCANIGTQESQKTLSEERAASVAEFLTKLKVRPPECIFTEGKGSANPLASDSTAEGRAKNRRVEITIVDE